MNNAVFYCDIDRVWDHILCDPGSVNAQTTNPVNHDRDGTPLTVAARSNQRDRIACLLICAGADPNVRNRSGLTALHVAVSTCNHAVAELLLAAGAWLDVRTQDINDKQDTPLTLAISYNFASMTQLLCAAKAHPDATDGCAPHPHPSTPPLPPPSPPHSTTVSCCDRAVLTPLQRACGYTKNGFDYRISDTASHVRLLLAARADANLASSDTLPPLHAAVVTVNVDAVIALVAAGADTAKRCWHQEFSARLTAYELAEKYESKRNMREILCELNPK